jgi:hypothetical protein
MKYLTITIDVEPDCSPSWNYSDPLAFDGVTTGVKDVLQPLFNEFGACPTYLINNVVLEDRMSVETFNSLDGRYELGAHLHSEFIDPEKRFHDYAGKRGEANQCYLPAEIEMAKMKNLTALFQQGFKRNPVSFRAGRFSAGDNTVRCLEALGYLVDTSVTPHIRWADKSREAPVDFLTAREQPYFLVSGSLRQEDGQGRILEVPVSITLQRTLRRKKFWEKEDRWLRPGFSSFRQMTKICDVFRRRYDSTGMLVLNMMFHNVEVLPGKSPYVRTKQDSVDYQDSIRRFLEYCQQLGIVCVSLKELYDALNRRRSEKL